MKKISVIVPAYNVEHYIERCVKSILNQTYENLEIILVDDGSLDRSGIMCDQFAEMDIRIIAVHKKNGGLSSARNFALEMATGDYITFVDSDDAIHPRMLEWMCTELEKENADIVSTGLSSFSSETPCYFEGNVTFEQLTQADYIDHLFPVNFGKISVTACGKLYKKEIFTELRYPEGVIYEDLQVYLPLLLKCKKISVCSEALYYWYNNEQSITRSNYLKHDRFREFAIREEYINFFKEKQLMDQMMLSENDYLTFFLRNLYAVFLKYPEKKEEFKYHIEIFKSHLKTIVKNPYVCKMRKICSITCLLIPKFSYLLAKKTIPDCLIEEMRNND